MRELIGVAWTVMWVFGMVIAKGFWSTFFAFATAGLWSLYLILERVMAFYGIAS